MKLSEKIKKITILLVLLLFVNVLFSQDTLKTVNIVYQADAETFDQLIKKNDGTFLDVRTKSEYDAEHIEGAGQLNFYALDFKKKLLMLPKDKPVYLYCNTDYRSQKFKKFRFNRCNCTLIKEPEWCIFSMPI